jgi:hypothetical protein
MDFDTNVESFIYAIDFLIFSLSFNRKAEYFVVSLLLLLLLLWLFRDEETRIKKVSN